MTNIPPNYINIDGEFCHPNSPRAKLRKQFPCGSAERQNQSPDPSGEANTSAQAVRPARKQVRQSSKPLLNALETAFYERIKNLYPNFPPVRAQAKRWKLANGFWYKADLSASSWPWPDGNHETAWEVKCFKGKGVSKGLATLKVAAATFPEVRFVLVWKDKASGWQEQTILP